ncbi:hypothetical protein [Marinobacter adhaerens]|jgi:hypothetical protein|uniref:hypothetical protein n=1 Tax=Marinobacter adhaerens TaxID=1033846 RepID=UPI003BAA7AC9
MSKFKKLTLATAISSAFILTGCGGSSGGSSDAVDNNDTGDTSTTAETGVFVDAAVAGVNYTTSPSGTSGQTNALGEYNYEAGDTVVFSIGGIDLPAVEATGRITPADMGSGATDWSSDQTVVNILRLLQTLDSDGDASNGINITEDVHTALQDIDLDPSVSETDFETQANTAINATGKTLIATEDAVNHFQSSQSGDLVGSWVFEETNGNVNVLTFLNDSEYLIAHSKADDGDQRAASAEYGTYTWDSASGQLDLTLVDESDLSGGLIDSNSPATWTMQLSDGALVLTSVGESEEVRFEAVRNTQDSLIGSWYLGEGFNEQKQIDRHNVLTILDDSTYVIVHNDNGEVYDGDIVEAVSSEWGTYSFNGSTFAVTSVSAELDGPGGLFDDPAKDAGGNGFVNGPGEFHPTGQLTLSDNLPVAEGGEPFTLRRLGRYAVTLKDFEGDTKQVYVEASGNDFIGGVTQTLSFADIDGRTPAEDGIFNMDAPGSATIDLVLNQDGSGYMDFDVSGDQNQIDSNGWSVLTSGSLTYVEGGVEWTYLPIKGSSPYTTLVYQGDMDLMFITEVTEAPQ